MATLKGWNLLMAAKGITSTRVWGFLQEPQPLVPRAPRGPPSPPRCPSSSHGAGGRVGTQLGPPVGLKLCPTCPCHGCPGCSSGRAPGLCSPAFSLGGLDLRNRAPRHCGRGAWPPPGDPALPHPSPPAPPGSGTAASCSSPPVSWWPPALARAPGLPSPPPPPPPPRAARPRHWPSSAGFGEQSVTQHPAGTPGGLGFRIAPTHRLGGGRVGLVLAQPGGLVLVQLLALVAHGGPAAARLLGGVHQALAVGGPGAGRVEDLARLLPRDGAVRTQVPHKLLALREHRAERGVPGLIPVAVPVAVPISPGS